MSELEGNLCSVVFWSEEEEGKNPPFSYHLVTVLEVSDTHIKIETQSNWDRPPKWVHKNEIKEIQEQKHE